MRKVLSTLANNAQLVDIKKKKLLCNLQIVYSSGDAISVLTVSHEEACFWRRNWDTAMTKSAGACSSATLSREGQPTLGLIYVLVLHFGKRVNNTVFRNTFSCISSSQVEGRERPWLTTASSGLSDFEWTSCTPMYRMHRGDGKKLRARAKCCAKRE